MTIADYTRNTVAVQAVQYDGDNQAELRDFGVTFTNADGMLFVQCQTAAVVTRVGDYVVRETGGTISVVPEAEFEAAYTVVEPEPEE
jgi:hypothetical protein